MITQAYSVFGILFPSDTEEVIVDIAGMPELGRQGRLLGSVGIEAELERFADQHGTIIAHMFSRVDCGLYPRSKLAGF
jgi:hypothetical protein